MTRQQIDEIRARGICRLMLANNAEIIALAPWERDALCALAERALMWEVGVDMGAGDDKTVRLEVEANITLTEDDRR